MVEARVPWEARVPVQLNENFVLPFALRKCDLPSSFTTTLK